MDNGSTVTQEGFQTLDEFNAGEKAEDTQLTLFNLKEFAVRNVVSVSELQEQLKTANEMYNDTFNNNPQYREEAQKAEEAAKKLKELKTQMQRQPSVLSQEQKIKEIKNEIKEKKESVSHAALEVYRRTGNSEFTTESGETYEIKTVAKLVKRKP